MSVLCRPVVMVPEHTISLEQTLELAGRLHADHDHLPQVLSMVSNTGVQKRHLVQPIDQTLRHPGFEARNLVYVQEVKARVPEVVHRALAHADLGPGEIDAIVFVSCTGFTIPSMIAWMINNLGFRTDTRQIPIAQLGCAAGGSGHQPRARLLHGLSGRQRPDRVLRVLFAVLPTHGHRPRLATVQRAVRGRGGGRCGACRRRHRHALAAQRVVPGSRHRRLDRLCGQGARLSLPARPARARNHGTTGSLPALVGYRPWLERL